MKRISRRSVWLLPLLCLFMNGYGQEYIPDSKPIPPNAAALFKTLERPTGSYTGTVPVEFPLCGVGSGKLAANLSLQYNGTGGIRVEEIASSVGLGFSLNDGGGRITQIVRGLGDDSDNGLLNNPLKPSNFNCQDMSGDVTASLDPNSLDLEPDIFLYSFNGQSGKFFFKENGTIVMMQKTGIKIAYTTNAYGINEWTITDEKGNVYYFSNKQSSDYTFYDEDNLMTNYGPSSYSWFLYQTRDISSENWLYYQHVVSGEVFTTISGGRMVLPPTSGCGGFNLNNQNMVTHTSSTEYIVSRITARNGFIIISSSTGRVDGYGRKVDSIKLFTTDSQLVKKYTFNYDYWINGTNMYEKRMYLKNFSEFGSSGNDSITHAFEYNTANPLPSRLSPNVDWWGYSNGMYNSTRLPNYVLKNGPLEYRNTSLGSKIADPNHGKTYTLKKIKLPTGGYREFIYEGNTALVGFDPNRYHPDASNSTNQGFQHYENEFQDDDENEPFFTKYFTINSTDGGANFSYTVTVPYACPITVKLYKTALPNSVPSGYPLFDHSYTSYSTNLDTGYYTMEFYRSSVTCGVSELSGSWAECTRTLGTVQSPHFPGIDLNENIETVGGVRVKEIRDYDPITAKTITTYYSYKIYSGDSTLTSGLLITPPQFIAVQMPSGVGCQVNAVVASGAYPLSSQWGSYVVYPEVRTTQAGNGWTDRIFNYAPDIPPTEFPYTPIPDGTNYRGHLLQEKIYDNSGTLLKKTVQSYTDAGTDIQQGGLKVRAYWYCLTSCPTADNWYDYDYAGSTTPTTSVCNSFTQSGYATDLEEAIDSSFTPAGVIVNKTKYEYDRQIAGQLFLKKVRKYLDGGKVKVTTFKYPFTSNGEYAFGLTTGEQTVKSLLTTLNQLMPLEVVDSLIPSSGSAILLGGSKFIYSVSGSVVHLNTIRRYTSMTDSLQVNLSGFDAAGNISEQYNSDNTKEVTLWGYGYAYPVVKVTGSDYSTVYGLINNSVLQNPSSDAALRTELDKIRTGLAGSVAQVTTYTYKKGVGISSETDPSGKVIYYEYDPLSRLVIVRDHNNKILKKFSYHINNPL